MIYHGQNDSKTTKSTFAYKTLGLCITRLGNGDFVFNGGKTGHSKPTNNFRYNFDSDVWTNLQKMTSHRYHHGCATIDKGEAKVIKISNLGDFLELFMNYIFAFLIVIQHNSKIELCQDLRFWDLKESYFVLNTGLPAEKVLVAGGLDSSDTLVSSAFLYQVSSDSWSQAQSLPHDHWSFFAIPDTLLAFSGVVGGNSYIYDAPGGGGWIEFPALNGMGRDMGHQNGGVFIEDDIPFDCID